MPTQKNNTVGKVNPAQHKSMQQQDAFGKHRQKAVYRGGHETRINAFVTSRGRRTQAKRDAR